MKSQFIGLWKSGRKDWYLSKALNECDFEKAKTGIWKIGLRKNKYYTKDSNRPEYIISFMDADSSNSVDIDLSKEWYQETVGELLGLLNIAEVSLSDKYTYTHDDICMETIETCKKLLEGLGVK